MYKSDHIKVLKILGADLPKRPSMKTSDIVSKGFKGAEDGDRRVRNAYRMLRKYNHIEIGERGEYKITQAGASLYDKLEKNGWKVPESEKPKRATPTKKAVKKAAKKAKPAAKKAAKKTVKKAAKKAAPKAKKEAKKVAKAKPAAKKATKGKMPSTGKKESKPAEKESKSAEKSEAKSNGTSASKGEAKAASSQLAF